MMMRLMGLGHIIQAQSNKAVEDFEVMMNNINIKSRENILEKE